MVITYEEFLNLTKETDERYEAIHRDVFLMPSSSKEYVKKDIWQD